MESNTPRPIRNLLHALVRALARARLHRRARHDARQLRAMSEHELSDLGIGRSEVPALLLRRTAALRACRSPQRGR